MTKELTLTHQHSQDFEYYLNVKFNENDIILNDDLIIPKEILNKLFYEFRQYEKTIPLSEIKCKRI